MDINQALQLITKKITSHEILMKEVIMELTHISTQLDAVNYLTQPTVREPIKKILMEQFSLNDEIVTQYSRQFNQIIPEQAIHFDDVAQFESYVIVMINNQNNTYLEKLVELVDPSSFKYIDVLKKYCYDKILMKQNKDLSNKNDKLVAKIAVIESLLKDANSEIKTLQTENSSLKCSVQNLENKISDLSRTPTSVKKVLTEDPQLGYNESKTPQNNVNNSMDVLSTFFKKPMLNKYSTKSSSSSDEETDQMTLEGRSVSLGFSFPSLPMEETIKMKIDDIVEQVMSDLVKLAGCKQGAMVMAVKKSKTLTDVFNATKGCQKFMMIYQLNSGELFGTYHSVHPNTLGVAVQDKHMFAFTLSNPFNVPTQKYNWLRPDEDAFKISDTEVFIGGLGVFTDKRNGYIYDENEPVDLYYSDMPIQARKIFSTRLAPKKFTWKEMVVVKLV
ncbi:hypothetical protein EHI8A_147220 [Entamoeba histolytica HM-1:IMSS-B]|uniref:TLDc domain-containing protein n=6 Tax=Entamoeba histolytica TaxID=5759 RepID=C4LUC5_ENTH1|nr:hypothetical protein EHI_110780 [Entamoeba histolytica HM-1:IMSS]EMD47983.1 Hypothetical protein EHI5A_130130 [Entamoeba histolytica KU27]EMH77674.1 hypothetical protein EHI8A_147220 [Entamoeba histolytica HM-1:IMSS-B]EMS11062.1 hypothetical protein KM1_084940 [Entamoeba histolytica HM-3:IMSS]ENY61529.1 hypothetical protein EHI7A_095410 [Entamoeba histolytica HM-1:IMSS-A]GAT92207.1 hypothetical protein CL6EHI_110780 [Entamoeba histolytica]|eukprot:XP_654276.1 hypothetical protein EHI_110780 [Entamoeba histolytica HM-1:IMSS]